MLAKEYCGNLMFTQKCCFENETKKILDANKIDIKAAEGRISPVMTDRLRLDEKRIRGMADGILDVAALPDPLSKTISSSVRPSSSPA